MISVDLCEKVFAFTEENSLFSAPCHVLLGLSGGADSMALLDVLCCWPVTGLQVSAVHVHHGLRGEWADRDEQFVRDLCSRYGVELYVEHVDVAALAAREGRTVEEAGRIARYAAFDRIADEIGADYILTAHTASDQAETVLMHVIRGCGTDGLVGIPTARDRIRRPLLGCTRAEIERYCLDNDVPHILDETNENMQFTRNRVRHEILPLLRQINSSVDEALIRLASHAGEDTAYLNEQADRAFRECNASAKALVQLPTPIRRRCILLQMRSLSVPSVEERHVLAIDELITNGFGAVCLPGGVTALVEEGRLVFRREPVTVEAPSPLYIEALPVSSVFGDCPFSLSIMGEEFIENEANVHNLFSKDAIDYDKIQGGLYIRPRKKGDYIRPAGRSVGKSVKKLMNECRIPVCQRDVYPLLCDELGVVLIPGYTCDERVRPGVDTKHFLVWQTANEQG